MVGEQDLERLRINKRRNILLGLIKDLKNDYDEGVSTSRIFSVAPKYGYLYGANTLYKDLNFLEHSDLIVKDVLYLGKGQGTRSVWNLASS